MNVTQELVDEIVARARQSPYGLGEGLTHKNGHLKVENYAARNADTLALVLVSGFEDKYDLVSVFRAALEVIEEKLQSRGQR